MCHSRTPRPPGSPPKSGVARRIRGKVLPPIPARRVGHVAAAFGPAIGAVIDAELAFVDVCVAVAAYAAGTDTTASRMAAKRAILVEWVAGKRYKGQIWGLDAGVVVAVLDFAFFGHTDELFLIGGSFFG